MRFFDQDRSVLAGLLSQRSLPLSRDVEAVVEALWDRTDQRPLAERLFQPQVPADPAYQDFLLRRLIESGLLVDGEVDEAAAWNEYQVRELEPLPHVDQVELTNACPMECPFCPRGRGEMTRSIGRLDLGLLAEIVAQVKQLPPRKPFGLHHFGDPLLNPELTRAVRIVADAGLEPELSINPGLLRPGQAEALIDAGVGTLIVALDGFDTATLQSMRGRAAGTFEQAAANVEQLIALAAQRQPVPTVVISMVATTLNRHQWPLLFEHYQRRELPWLKPVLRALDDFGNPDITPLGVHRLRQLCATPFHFVTVLWDGTVVPCCHDFDGRMALGNLARHSLEQVWAGDVYQRFRERFAHARFDDDEPCRRCPWHVVNYVQQDHIALSDAWTLAAWPERPWPSIRCRSA